MILEKSLHVVLQEPLTIEIKHRQSDVEKRDIGGNIGKNLTVLIFQHL